MVFQMDQVDEFVYEFEFEAHKQSVGTMIIEVLVDGEYIPESPFRFAIIPRDCFYATGDEYREPDDLGSCICAHNSLELFGKCVANSIFLPCVIIPFLLLLAWLTSMYVEYKKKQSDTIWKVNPADLMFDAPPAELGEGSFGLVVLGHYRGTQGKWTVGL